MSRTRLSSSREPCWLPPSETATRVAGRWSSERLLFRLSVLLLGFLSLGVDSTYRTRFVGRAEVVILRATALAFVLCSQLDLLSHVSSPFADCGNSSKAQSTLQRLGFYEGETVAPAWWAVKKTGVSAEIVEGFSMTGCQGLCPWIRCPALCCDLRPSTRQ